MNVQELIERILALMLSPEAIGATAVIGVFCIIVLWKVFVKAGLPAWGILIPIYNTYLMIKLAGRPGWWLILILLPPVYFVLGIIMCIDVAKNFGKGAGFGVGIIFLSPIFLAILAFDDSEYQPAAIEA